MGNIQQPTHAKRSPGMSFVSLWQHELKRIVIMTALLSFVAFSSIQAIIYVATHKEITIVLNGEYIVKETRLTQLDLFLDEQSIVVGEHDRISHRLDAKLKDGDTITIDHTMPVFVRADGLNTMQYTTGQTVQAVLKDLNIPLNKSDRTFPAPHESVGTFDRIEVVRVHSIFEEQEIALPYESITVKDNNLEKGKLRLVQEGEKGVLLKTLKSTFENGRFIKQELIGEQVVAASVDEVVAIGNKNPVTILSASSPDIQNVSKEGLTFGVKQVLDNVTLTAYDAGFNSTGKTEDHPYYGVTYSGAIVEEGRTIAVDPKVIPLGWWVYIDGIGLRKAEDIGSAIKGKIIDVYMESEDEANRFGRQRGYTVYIVGPDKPATN